MIRIPVTPELQAVADLLGTMRTITARAAGVKDANIGSHDGLQSDKDGMLAELAVAKHFNVWPDISVSARTGTYDLMIHGKRVDVKTTRHANGRLLATTKINLDVDVYMLTNITNDFVQLIGYATRERLTHPSNLTNLGHGEGYALTQDQLTPFKEGK